MNELRDPLEAICGAVRGVYAATIMGLDGLEVDSFQVNETEDMDVASLLVEYSTLLSQVQRSAQMFEAGDLEEVSITSENLTTIIRSINAEYFLALTMLPRANFGKGRYLLRIQAPKLAPVLS